MKKKRKNKSMPSHEERKTLPWTQRKRIDRELGQITENTRQMIKSRFRNIRKKMNADSTTAGFSTAIGEGLFPPLKTPGLDERVPKLKVCIIGCGKGGTAILNIFKEDPSIEVTGVADVNIRASGIKLAKNLKIPIARDYHDLLKKDVSIIINVTGSKEVSDEIKRIKPRDAELIEGLSARLLWQLVEERRKRIKEREKALKEHEALYHLGLIIESIDSMKDAGLAIVDYATRLTSTPAGSLAVFDERNEDMVLVASKGFSREFRKIKRWEIRKGGLTSYILNQKVPLVINDLTNSPDLNPLILREGVKAFLVAPLTTEGRIVGILYVNDFNVRKFSTEEISLFSLLTVYAALTIERVKSIEEMRVLSITDGLTGLYNHRYLMGQMQRELRRASRHGNPLSLIMLDIDHFKDYNDKFGHLEGNKVLKNIARLLINSARITDTVGRFGGEEFCIIAPDIKKPGAVTLAKRIVQQVADTVFPYRGVTVSGGVATFPKNGKTSVELIKRADTLLYKAKQRGRNRVCS